MRFGHHIALFAQTDPISGGAGWLGAGLLGAVLAWLLLRHLPAKDQQIERLVASRDVMVKELAAVFGDQLQATRGELKSIIATFSEEQRSIREELKGIVAAFSEEQRVTRHDSRDTLNVILLRNEVLQKEMVAAMKSEFQALAENLGHVTHDQS